MMIPAAGNSWKRFTVAILLLTAGRHFDNNEAAVIGGQTIVNALKI
jgi:hypothetical protein